MRAWAILSGLVLAAGPLLADGAAWRRDAYVWQRLHGEAVASALADEKLRERVTGFYTLAAEVAWEGAEARVVRVALDHAALRATGRPVGLVLRVGPHAGPFANDDATARLLGGLARELLDAARADGLEPAELQVDFDCAERALGGYRAWLVALREATGATPLTFTALPAWLRHEAEFGALAAAADGFVLQVHSLEKPTGGPDAAYSLVDHDRALAWTEAAARAGGGRPFRVALPTYGYRLAFDARGEFFALSAEGPAPRWPADTQTRVVRADPAEMLRIERALADNPPAGCAGVIWFRLPVADDRLNWDAATFARVLAGEAPRARLELTASRIEPGLVEIVADNRGDAATALPGRLRVTWPPDARLVAADGLGGYETTRRGMEPELLLKDSSDARDVLLGPGKTRRIAWLRFADETIPEITPLDEAP